jgi:ribonucleotide reductase alpha subunit
MRLQPLVLFTMHHNINPPLPNKTLCNLSYIVLFNIILSPNFYQIVMIFKSFASKIMYTVIVSQI